MLFHKFKFFLFISLAFVLFSCGHNNLSTSNDNLFGYSPDFVQRTSIDTLTLVQVDSIISVDKLKSLNTWKTTNLTDFESNITYKTAVYYKATTKTIYTIKFLQNKLYVVEKKKMN